MPTDDLFANSQTAFEEVLSHLIGTFAAVEDPVFRDIEAAFEGVTSPSELSRDFVIHKLFRNELSGVIEPMAARSDWSLRGDNFTTIDDKQQFQELANWFPDPFDASEPLEYRLSVPMRGFDLSLGSSLAESQADAIPAFLSKRMPIKLAGFARRISRRLTEAWYTSQHDGYRLATIGASSGTNAYAVTGGTSGAVTFIEFTPTEECFGRFHVGDLVDLVKDVASVPTRINEVSSSRVKGYVSRVDANLGRVRLAFLGKNDAGTDVTGTTWAATGTIGEAAYVISTWGSQNYTGFTATNNFKGVAGIHSYMKFGHASTAALQRLLGNEAYGSEASPGGIINVESHPEFRSTLFTGVGQLTETKLGIRLARFYNAHEDRAFFLDTLVTTEAVLQSYLSTKLGLYMLDRTNRVQNLNAEGNEVGQLSYVYNGRKHMIRTSRWMSAGELIGYRRRGNWQRFLPPSPPGYTPAPGVKPFANVKFVGKSLGMPGPKMPYQDRTTGAFRAGVQMPALMHIQFVPKEQVPGIKLTGLTESRLFAERSA